MGVRTTLGDEGARYLRENYKSRIDAHLKEIAGLLAALGASPEQTVRSANHVADVTALGFQAGMEFAIKNGMTSDR